MTLLMALLLAGAVLCTIGAATAYTVALCDADGILERIGALAAAMAFSTLAIWSVGNALR